MDIRYIYNIAEVHDILAKYIVQSNTMTQYAARTNDVTYIFYNVPDTQSTDSQCRKGPQQLNKIHCMKQFNSNRGWEFDNGFSRGLQFGLQRTGEILEAASNPNVAN